jgi:hypothetical protein
LPCADALSIRLGEGSNSERSLTLLGLVYVTKHSHHWTRRGDEGSYKRRQADDIHDCFSLPILEKSTHESLHSELVVRFDFNNLESQTCNPKYTQEFKMCSPDLFLGLIAILFPPLAGKIFLLIAPILLLSR